MWEHTLVTTTDVPAGRLWAVVTEPRSRSVWAGDGADAGAIEEAVPAARAVFVTRRLLSRLRTVYEFESDPAGTRIRVAVRLSGPLGFLRRRAGEESAERLAERTRQLVQRARELAEPRP